MAQTVAKKPKLDQTVVIFHASRKPNANGELNWCETKIVEQKMDLTAIQDLVGARIVTMLPCYRKTTLECYVDEEGLLNQNYARNDLAGGALFMLGFGGGQALGCAYAGNVVVTGKKMRSLTAKQQAELKDAIEKYRKDDDDDDDDSVN